MKNLFKKKKKDDDLSILNKRKIKKIKKKSYKKKGPTKFLQNKTGNIIDVLDVTKTYFFGNEEIPVLRNISFGVKQGDVVVIFGKSGSGKSTLLNLISGLDWPTEGDVVVKNQNLAYLNAAKLTEFRRKNISFIFQSYNLFDNLNCYDNVETGAYLSEKKITRQQIYDLFKEFEMEDKMFKFPKHLSGGQQQRVSILRALVKKTPVIFADEPTGALDSSTSKIVLKTLKKINQEFGTTIVMVSHDPDVGKLANQVISIVDGKISSIEYNEKPSEVD